jgi:hypothetical protein
MPLPLYPRGNSLQYPFDRRLGGPQSGSGQHGEEKIHDTTGTWNSEPSGFQPVASRYPGSLLNMGMLKLVSIEKIRLCFELLEYYISKVQNIFTCRGVRVTKISGSISDDWIYWHFGYTFSLNYD